MISFLSGTVRVVEHTGIILEAAGIGWQVGLADTSPYAAGQKIDLYIYLQWHQENGPVLYGFTKSEERHLFSLILGCSGMGPKVALALLGGLGFSRCLKALASNDSGALSSVQGIGQKKAESLILQLKDKVAKLLQSGAFVCEDDTIAHVHKIHDVLVSLHYSRTEVQRALDYLKTSETYQQATFDESLRKALGFLAKKLS